MWTISIMFKHHWCRLWNKMSGQVIRQECCITTSHARRITRYFLHFLAEPAQISFASVSSTHKRSFFEHIAAERYSKKSYQLFNTNTLSKLFCREGMRIISIFRARNFEAKWFYDYHRRISNESFWRNNCIQTVWDVNIKTMFNSWH